MSGRLLRLVCTAAAAGRWSPPRDRSRRRPRPSPRARDRAKPRSPGLLTDLQRLYRRGRAGHRDVQRHRREAEEAARRGRRDWTADLRRPALSLQRRPGAAGRLARQQYQGAPTLSPYVRLLLARDPQQALDQGHVIGQLARERAETVGRLTGGEKGTPRWRARPARPGRAAHPRRTAEEGPGRRARAAEDVEELLASLSPEQLAELAEFEKRRDRRRRRRSSWPPARSAACRPPSKEGEQALRYAVGQIGKPYEWGAEGPAVYDCSGLTSRPGTHAGRPIPRTSQEQWAQLPQRPADELRPGDLVVYFPEATHVAMYLGDGMVVQAPRPGAR